MPRATHSHRLRISASEARRLALAAQGFADPRPDGEPGGWDLRRVLKRVALLQIDSVNVLERAHYLPAFSRLGPYPTAALDRLSQRAPRRLFEYWGHEASLIGVDLQPLLRWRMERAEHEAWGGMLRVQDERPELVESVLEQVRERGPIAASELEEKRPRRSGPWWDWSDSKRAIEWLFFIGQVTAARRRRFERLYDLPERVIPAEVLAAPTPAARGGPARAAANRLTGARGRRRARPARLLPARGRDGEAADRRAGRGRRPAPGRGRGLGPDAGLPRRRRPDPPAGRGDRAGRAVRLGALGAQPPAADLGLRLPAGDLRPGAEAASTATTCCRFCSATGSSPGST